MEIKIQGLLQDCLENIEGMAKAVRELISIIHYYLFILLVKIYLFFFVVVVFSNSQWECMILDAYHLLKN